MPVDYRYDPFQDVLNAVTISGETHIIPSVSPFTIRLDEVPLKETPSSISLTIDGVAAEEVSSSPAAGQFWPDYSTGADGDDTWNTGTILFNSADAGKTVVVTYKGTGAVVWADLINTYVFTESGTITAPHWGNHAILSGCAGGGAGGITGNSNTYAGGGGGPGGCCINFAIKITPGQTYTITIGAGGATTSAVGGNTSFGNLLTLTGGANGWYGNMAGAGGASGTGPAGNFGQTGATSGVVSSAGGTGGSTPWGLGGSSNNAASGYGSGGGGRYNAPNAGWRPEGGPGLMIIRWVHI